MNIVPTAKGETMAEYIDKKDAACAACKGCNFLFSDEPCEPSLCRILEEIATIPTADVAPVVRGEWIEHDEYICNSDGKPVAKIGTIFVCSLCGREERRKEPYCHCGAKMDGGQNE